MSPKYIFALGTVALLLFIAVTYGLRAAYPRIVVEYRTSVTGRVTGSFQTKGYHTFFLNGKTNARHDVDAFTPVEPAAEPPRTERRAGQGSGTDLGDFLRKGDYLRKSAYSTELTVQRGERIFHWACPAEPQ